MQAPLRGHPARELRHLLSLLGQSRLYYGHEVGF
jgi:hypothetical protein